MNTVQNQLRTTILFINQQATNVTALLPASSIDEMFTKDSFVNQNTTFQTARNTDTRTAECLIPGRAETTRTF